MTESEVWKDVMGYEGLYKVSDKGNIYSVERISLQGNKCGGRTLKPVHDSYGYLVVTLHKNGNQKTKKIHRLVTEAFMLNPNNYPDVNHKDEAKDNNELPNLEWCDKSYNNNHGTRNKRIGQKKSRKVRAVNVESGEVIIFSSVAEAGRKGFSIGAVSVACRGIYKNGTTGKLIGDGHLYKGHRWSYEEEK